MLRWGSRLAGVPLPAPEHVPLENPLPIARWMGAVRGEGRTPHLFAFPSAAVALARVALDAGFDLGGVQLTLTGEALTAARLETRDLCNCGYRGA